MRNYIRLPEIERFADVVKLTQLVEQVHETRLSQREAKAVQEFRNALERRAKGKPDEAWQDERDGYEVVPD